MRRQIADTAPFGNAPFAPAPLSSDDAFMDGLICPKCHAGMRQYERSGVHVDLCTECRGIFLDRGELERMIDAETAWARSAEPAPPVQPQYQPPPVQPQYQQPQYQQPQYQQPGYYGKPYKKRKSFLEELFD
jgi:Zn-finger nucleic acid-binding protein